MGRNKKTISKQYIRVNEDQIKRMMNGKSKGNFWGMLDSEYILMEDGAITKFPNLDELLSYVK